MISYFVFQLFPDDSKTEVRYINLGDKFDFFVARKYVMRFSIWYHLYNLKNVFFAFFELCKWYQIVQNITDS